MGRKPPFVDDIQMIYYIFTIINHHAYHINNYSPLLTIMHTIIDEPLFTTIVHYY